MFYFDDEQSTNRGPPRVGGARKQYTKPTTNVSFKRHFLIFDEIHTIFSPKNFPKIPR